MTDRQPGPYFPAMALLPILVAPDPVLTQISTAVETVDDDIRRTLDDMLETMYAAPGIGLAAIQVGIPKRMLVIDVSREDEEKQPLYIINPEVTWVSDDDQSYEEGCLSLPEHYAEVVHPAEVKIGMPYLAFHAAMRSASP